MLKELILTMAVVFGFIWIPCGICGLAWIIKWMIRERRWWKAAQQEEFPEEYGEEVIYR